MSDGHIIATGEGRLPRQHLYEGQTIRFRLKHEGSELSATDFLDPRWSIRIRGSGEIALRDFEAKRYWAGELTFPTHDPPK